MDETLMGDGTDDSEVPKDNENIDKQEEIGENQGGKENEDNNKTENTEEQIRKKVYRSRKKVQKISERKKSDQGVHDSDCEILPEEYRNLSLPPDWEPKISNMDWPGFKEVLNESKKIDKFPEAIKFKEFDGTPKDINPEHSLFYSPKGATNVEMPKKPGPGCSYKNRKLLSPEVASVLDQWSKDWAKRKLSGEMYCFHHRVEDHLCCTVGQLRDVFLSGSKISSEVSISY